MSDIEFFATLSEKVRGEVTPLAAARICGLGNDVGEDHDFKEEAEIIRMQCLMEREVESNRRPVQVFGDRPLCPLREPKGPSDPMEEEMARTGWQKISLAIDSGAAETVIPHLEVRAHPIKETESSRRGVTYASATGAPIPNLGEQTLPLLTQKAACAP